MHNFKPLVILCGCTARFVSDLVGNPEDRFSHNEAHIGSRLELHLSLVVRKPVFGVFDQVLHKLGCAVTADDWRLENLDLERGGIVLSMKRKQRQ